MAIADHPVLLVVRIFVSYEYSAGVYRKGSDVSNTSTKGGNPLSTIRPGQSLTTIYNRSTNLSVKPVRVKTLKGEQTIMNLRIGLTGAFGAAVMVMFVMLTPIPAQASGLDSGTAVTFDQPVEIPGKVLPAGTYAFVQEGPAIVRVWDKDQTHLIATLVTNSAEQQQFEPRQEFEFDSQDTSKPKVLKAWFFDSGTLGREFIYENTSK